MGGRSACRHWPTSPSSEPVILLEEGAVSVTLLAEGLVVRPEAVVKAPAAGRAERLIAEGERVRTGTPVVRLTPGPGVVAAPLSGVVSYQVDGLEEALAPANASQWTPLRINSLRFQGSTATGEGEVAEGTPLFKVVDNLALGLLVVAPADRVASLSEASKVRLRLNGEEAVITARTTRWEREGEEALLHLTALDQSQELTGRRRVQVSLILGTYEGMIAPRTAIDIREGVQGVWVQHGGRAVFHRVRVLGGNEAEVALETDLPRGTRIFRSAPRHL